MKYAKKPMALILSLVLCMGLSACGNDPPKPPPDSFEGMVKESKISEESSRYLGSWQGEEESFDFQPLEGTWAMDGVKNPKSVLDIDDEGGWHLRERPGKKGKFKEVDSGTLRAKGEGRFEAVSDDHEGVVYDMTVVDKKTLYWGGENDHYQKMK